MKKYALLIMLPAMATAEVNYSLTFIKCRSNESNNADLANCISEETNRQEKRLNKVYNQYLKTLSPNHSKAFKEAQRAWIKYKDLSMKAAAMEYEGGSLAGISSSYKYMDMTIEKADEIEKLLKEANSR
ncbi:lysozyme inhibitor LprI family protein [Mannheimia bovis]|uniref:lysozyme inhibitor LprI family protein n=1 Tax=Mannheimia bovis TaxID=2770636 RepID=UPI0024B63727|nr:lysozyme inhibitor LprI family protein [Mannheimia bovis]WHP46856.1 lysozyme inhibitor LprI family protein [Mannheimia bovis]